MISHYILTGLGGAIGAISRVFLGKMLPSTFIGIPIAILCINILGCFLMGLLAESMSYRLSIPENVKYLMVSGFLGGFTTFSAFTLEFGLLFEKNLYKQAFLYATLSFVLSVACFFLGLKIIKLV